MRSFSKPAGLADPHAIAQVALANPAIRLDGVLTLVDAETFLNRLEDPGTAALIRSQLTAADLVVLNKVDLLGDGKDLVRTRLREIAGQRAVVEAVQSDIPVDVVLGIDAKRSSGFQCVDRGAPVIILELDRLLAGSARSRARDGGAA